MLRMACYLLLAGFLFGFTFSHEDRRKYFSLTSVDFLQTTRRYITEDVTLIFFLLKISVMK